MQIIEIIWIDAQSSLAQLTIEQAKKELKPKHTKTVGYLAHETNEYMLIVFMEFGEGTFKHWQLIPKSLIKSQRIIRK